MDNRMDNRERITVQELVRSDMDAVWDAYTGDAHIKNWYYATPAWHAPRAVSSLRPGGQFSYRLESRDGAHGFDFAGTFDIVDAPHHLAYTLTDGRQADVRFTQQEDGVFVTVSFDPDQETDLALQRSGWQAILTNFRTYAEGLQTRPNGGDTGA